jgi:hypothetical protein
LLMLPACGLAVAKRVMRVASSSRELDGK